MYRYECTTIIIYHSIHVKVFYYHYLWLGYYILSYINVTITFIKQI